MFFQQRRRNIMEAKRTKTRMAYLASQTTHNKTTLSHHGNCSKHGWFIERKKAVERLSSLTGDRIMLLENGYRGHHRRHWLKDNHCDHVFLASLREVITIGAESICPFCKVPSDLSRCGSVHALQEHVYHLSHGNTALLENNELGKPDDLYEMTCLIHRYQFWTPYRDFVEKSRYVCPHCALETWRF